MRKYKSDGEVKVVHRCVDKRKYESERGKFMEDETERMGEQPNFKLF